MTATMEPQTMTFAELGPVLPKKKVMLALPTCVSIFCSDYKDAASLVNQFLDDHDYEMISAVTTMVSGDWEYKVDDDFYLFRWRYPTMASIRGTKGDFAYVKHNILDPLVIDYIRANHAGRVYFF